MKNIENGINDNDFDNLNYDFESKPENFPKFMPVEYFPKNSRLGKLGILESNNYPDEVRLVLIDETNLDFYHKTGKRNGLRIVNAKGKLNIIKDPEDTISNLHILAHNKYGSESQPAKYMTECLLKVREMFKPKNTRLLQLPVTDEIEYKDLFEKNEHEKVRDINEYKALNFKHSSFKNRFSEEYYQDKSSNKIIPIEHKTTDKLIGQNSVRIKVKDRNNIIEDKISSDNDKTNILEKSKVINKKKDLRALLIGKSVFYIDELNKIIKAKIINFDDSGRIFDIEILKDNCIEQKTIALKDVCFERYELENKMGINTIGLSERLNSNIDSKNIITDTTKLQREEKIETIKNILLNADNSNINADILYTKLTDPILLSTDSIGIITNEISAIIDNFQCSVVFNVEIDSQKACINDFRERINKMDIQGNKYEIKYLLNQFIKLKWLQKEGAIFAAKFDNENWVNGGMRIKIKELCQKLFSKYIGGEYDAAKAIDHWSKNKNWLYSQTEMIIQADLIENNSGNNKKTLWQKGLKMVKGWFGK